MQYNNQQNLWRYVARWQVEPFHVWRMYHDGKQNLFSWGVCSTMASRTFPRGAYVARWQVEPFYLWRMQHDGKQNLSTWGVCSTMASRTFLRGAVCSTMANRTFPRGAYVARWQQTLDIIAASWHGFTNEYKTLKLGNAIRSVCVTTAQN